MNMRTEPVAVVAAIRVIIVAAVTLGLVTWTDIQIEAVLTAVALGVIPLIEILSNMILRSRVTCDHTLNNAGMYRLDNTVVPMDMVKEHDHA